MAKAELKTKVNDASVMKFLHRIADEQRRNDCFEILKMKKQITKEEPKMWGSSIVGFGSYHYKGKSGREGDWMLTGFSPRKPVVYQPRQRSCQSIRWTSTSLTDHPASVTSGWVINSLLNAARVSSSLPCSSPWTTCRT